MIPYVEVIGKTSLKPFAIVEPSQCWFELSYYEIGEFEVYCEANQNNLNALKGGNYVKIPNKPYLWVIKSVEYSFTANGARMISAKGYEAKWIIGQRIILAPTTISTNLATAIYNLISLNLGDRALAPRKISGFSQVQGSFNITISDTQATRENLWDFIANLLKSYKCGAYSTFINGNIVYNPILGVDRSDRVIFAQSFDNLINSDYLEDSSNYKTYCRVVSTFKENNTETDYVQDYNKGGEGINRYEMVVESNISAEYAPDPEHPETKVKLDLTDEDDLALYQSWQEQEGKNQLAEKIIQKDFSADIDLLCSHYAFEEDFFIGDLVMIRDEDFDISVKARILKYTFKQDEKGYGEEANYQME